MYEILVKKMETAKQVKEEAETKLFGVPFRIKIDPHMPPDQLKIVSGGKVVRVVNIGGAGKCLKSL